MNRAAVGFSVLVACAALARAGDDAKSFDIEWAEKWKAGQTVTVEKHVTTNVSVTMGGSPLRDDKSILDASYVVRCDEADAQGAAVKRTVWFKKWKQSENTKVDDSLSDKQVIVEGNTWKLSDGTAASGVAKTWLDETFVKENSTSHLLAKLTPPAHMAVGETWKPDSKALREAFAKQDDEAPLVEGCTLEWKLVAVDGTPPDAVVHGEFKAKYPLGGEMKQLPPGAKLSADSAMETTGTSTGAAQSRLADTVHSETTVNMTIDMGAAGSVVTSVKESQDEKKTLGGDIPALPKPATPPAPATPDKK